MDFIPYAQQSLCLEDAQAAFESLSSPIITRGPLVSEFEQRCAKFCNAKYAFAFNSGTNAFSAANYAANLTAEDTLVTSPNTFVGTVAGGLQKTSQLKLLDIDLKNGCSQFEDLQRPSKGRLFLYPVHFSGIALLIQKPFENCIIIEDACEAFGSLYPNGQKVGSCPYSDMTVFSFHPAKTITTGEGGLVTTNSPEYAKRLQLYRNNGIIRQPDFEPGYYEVLDVTTNCNFTDFQAAIGLSQLKRIHQLVEQRMLRVMEYKQRLQDYPFIRFLDSKYDPYSAHNLMPLLIHFEDLNITRQQLMLELQKRGIGTQIHFIPLYRHPYFQKRFHFKRKHFPYTEIYYSQELSFPLFAHLTTKQIQFICNTLVEISTRASYIL